jgi:S1-C subfamily serine protease
VRRRAAFAVGLAIVAIAAVAVALAARGTHRHDPVVVRVELESATGAADTATGFGVGPGRIVTVAHVLDPARRLLVRSPDGRMHRARLLREDRTDDLALIAVPGLQSRALADTASSGERLLVKRAGHTAVVPAVVRRHVNATVRGPDWGPYRRPALELGSRVELGDSGAPLVDGSGHVAAVLFARSTDAAGTAYAVDVSAVNRLLTKR